MREDDLQRLSPAPDGGRLPLPVRARAAIPSAAVFGGVFAGATLLRVLASVLATGALPSLVATGAILGAVIAAFLGFGGLAFLVHLAGPGGAASDRLEVSGWLSAAVIGSIVAFLIGLVAGARAEVNLWWAVAGAVGAWLALLGAARGLFSFVRR